MMDERHKALEMDVCIIGGGPAGLATALMLRKHDSSLTIGVFEAGDYTSPRIGESVGPDLDNILAELDAQSLLNHRDHWPSAGVSSNWEADSIEYNDFNLYPQGRGWHLDRALFDRRLAELCTERDIQLGLGKRYLHGELTDSFWRLSFHSKALATKIKATSAWYNDHCTREESSARKRKDEASQEKTITVKARFVVDASGRAAKFSHQQGSRVRSIDSMVCIYAYLDQDGSGFNHQLAGKPEAGAYSSLLSCCHGWWYQVGLPNNKCFIGLMTDSDIARQKGLKNSSIWCDTLMQSLPNEVASPPEQAKATSSHRLMLLDQASVSGGLQVWPAYSQYRSRIAGFNWLAVGDAAVCYDPLSSQGIAKSIKSGIYAGHALYDYFNTPDKNVNNLDKTKITCHPALVPYVSSVSVQFTAYYRGWAQYYLNGQRWPNCDFWQRRSFDYSQINPHAILTLVQSQTPVMGSPSGAANAFWPSWKGMPDWQKQTVLHLFHENDRVSVWKVVKSLKNAAMQYEQLNLPDDLFLNNVISLIQQRVLGYCPIYS